MKRWDIINLLIVNYELSSYLEIGVHQMENYRMIGARKKDCVDPNFPATFPMTSDEFFKDTAYHTRIGDVKLQYDLVFIDGLHTSEQTYKDIINSLTLDPMFIVVHDCNPQTRWHTRPESEYKRGEEWNGTTYKGFIKFKDEHPELSCFTVNTDYGCGVITYLPLLDNISVRFNGSWSQFDVQRKELLQLISPDRFRELIYVDS